MDKDNYRIEKDSLGEVRVPADALFGPQTQRAVENFPVSGIRFPRVFIRTLGLIKAAAAEVNAGLGLLDAGMATAIKQAAEETAQGLWDEHFPVDIFQTGSGTSTNMNANEVIARRASQILGGPLVHPNDHVNMCQSSNDVIPSAIHVSAFLLTHELLIPALKELHSSLSKRAAELDGIVKTGRTHLMDALPLRLGQEIGGWAFQVSQYIESIQSFLPRLGSLALGGTAVGTGLNAHPEFARRVTARLAELTGLPFTESENHFAAQSCMDAVVELSGRLKTAASSIMKLCNDLRWMASGPVSGLAEISFSALQPGSSIMPGKTNPVICEAAMMACVQVIANDTAITTGNYMGNFQLNTMMPLLAHNLLQSLTLLGNSASLLAEKAVSLFTVNREHLEELLEKNRIAVTALTPVTGYDLAVRILETARAEGRSLKDTAVEMAGLSPEEAERLLNPRGMTEGGMRRVQADVKAKR